jgi:hypothetical protein
MTTLSALTLCFYLNFVTPDVTYFIYSVEEPFAREAISAKLTLGDKEKTEAKDEAACFSATIPLRQIGDKESKVVAYAGSQWGRFELKGKHVIAQQTCKSGSSGLAAFLKQNGYETIPEKEEEPK